MNKQDLINGMRREFGFTWRDSERAVDTVIEAIRKGLTSGEKVFLRGFGTFSVTDIKTKKFRNIHSGKMQTRVIKNRVKFKPSGNILKK